MNATNQIFNWKRFTATMRKEVAENWRLLVFVALGVYLWYTISMIISNVTTMSGTYNINPFFFVIVAAILAGGAYRQFTTRSGRTELLTSPSSTTEKFITNVLLYVVSAFIIFAVAFQLADITRYVVMLLINPKLGIESTVPNNLVENFNMIQNHVSYERTLVYTVLIETLGAGSVFLLGSVMWPHRSSIKTILAILLIQLSKIIIGGSYVFSKYGENLYILPKSALAYTLEMLANINMYFDILFFVLCWIVAWYTVKHKDVITLKWWK